MNVDSMTRDELRTVARTLDIPGRGRMSAAELREAVRLAATPARNRYRDRVARGEMVVRTPAGVGGRRAIIR